MTLYDYHISHGLFDTLNYIKLNDDDFIIITETVYADCGGYIP